MNTQKLEYKQYRLLKELRPSYAKANLDVLLSLSEDEVIELEREWKETQDYNREITKKLEAKRKDAIDRILSILKEEGVATTTLLKNNRYVDSKIVKQIRAAIPSIYRSEPGLYFHSSDSGKYEGIDIMIYKSPTSLTEFYRSAISQVNKQKMLQEKESAEKNFILNYIQSLGESWNWNDYDGNYEKAAPAIVNLLAKSWMEENYPEYTSVGCGCDECSTYTIGDHRCECGNRRINAYPEYLGKGEFYLEVECY